MVPPRAGQPGWAAYATLLLQINLASGNTEVPSAWADSLLHLPGATTQAWLKVDPLYAPLRGDPRFQRLWARN